MRHQLLILTMLLVATTAFAQYSDEQLYDAYLNNRFDVWETYITTADWEKLSLSEQKRLVHYEFGYTGRAIKEKKANADDLLEQYKQHLEALRPNLSSALYHLYHGAEYSFELTHSKAKAIKYGGKVYDEIDEALAAAPMNPVVVTMRGQLDLYNPFGSTSKSLNYFIKADSLYHVPGAHYYKWNIRAEQMAYLIALSKLNRKEDARKMAKDILANEEPGWLWLKKEFLPSLDK